MVKMTLGLIKLLSVHPDTEHLPHRGTQAEAAPWAGQTQQAQEPPPGRLPSLREGEGGLGLQSQEEGWMEMRQWCERVTLDLGPVSLHQKSQVPRARNKARTGNMGRGTYLPSRPCDCSEGLASLFKKRTEAQAGQTFLLPGPRRPLPGGGGRIKRTAKSHHLPGQPRSHTH